MSIVEKTFKEVNLEDNFFDSLRSDYNGFNDWFEKKAEEKVHILETTEGIQAFLYMKKEKGENEYEIEPRLPAGDILKIGTFKVNSHGTKLGERFIKLIFDKMIDEKYKRAYITIFEKQVTLLELLKKYGFEYWGQKIGGECVYIKNLENITNDICLNYPLINTKKNKKFLLAIHPDFHTELFPDSRLRTEKNHTIKDLSHTNCIEKIYLSAAHNLENFSRGDIAVIYRTGERGKSAEYSSVVTSICTVKQIKNINDFNKKEDFFEFCKNRTIFSKGDLEIFWKNKKYPYIIILLYNVALNKRIVRKDLIEEIGVDRRDRIVAYEIADLQMEKILEMGRNDKNFITY